MNQIPILDSVMDFEEATAGISVPLDILETLSLLTVQYLSFDERVHEGQLIVHRDVAHELEIIFEEIREARFPIASVIPIAAFGPDQVHGGWDDEASMSANNTSAFNYRPIFGTDILSNHSRGLAIDINPLLNPCTAIDGTIQPRTGSYDPLCPGTLTSESDVVRIFKMRGWKWLGHRERKDWQHFSKGDTEV